jgi:hypothetical protein
MVAAKAAAAAGKRTCASCEKGFIGRSNARFCSPACKQRAHRSRKGSPEPRVTVMRPAVGGHCAEALAFLAELDAELAEKATALGSELVWSAAERVNRESAACVIDRLVQLTSASAACDDDKAWLKFSAERRLLEMSLLRLVKALSTDLPVQPSIRSRKAAKAAEARWRRAAY